MIIYTLESLCRVLYLLRFVAALIEISEDQFFISKILNLCALSCKRVNEPFDSQSDNFLFCAQNHKAC